MGAGIQPGGLAGMANAPAGVRNQVTLPQEYSGIASALERMASSMTDADTARNLRWQRAVNGETTKMATWKIEATAAHGLQFFAYMQPGEAFVMMGHSMSTIYSTATDIASFHGKIVLFMGDRKITRECTPVVLPPQSAFEWKKCKVIDNPTSLQEWYANNTDQYGKLWDPQATDGTKVEVCVPRMIALPLRAAQIYQQHGGAVMPHELLTAIEAHLASPGTTLGNGDEWGLIKKWLLVAAQMDGNPTKSKSHIAFATDAILTNDEHIHQWFNERIDATLGRRPEATTTSTPGGMQENMVAVSGMIAAEVGKGMGKAMQRATRSNPTPASISGSSDDAKPYTQDHIATLLVT